MFLLANARRLTCADPVPSALLFSFSVLPTKEGNCRSPSAGVFEPKLIIAPASLNSYRQRPFRFCGRDRDVGSGDDDALGLRSFNQPRSGSLLLVVPPPPRMSR